MATPYLQSRREEVTSTQDLARAELELLPVVVISPRQTQGRGRSGVDWVTAPRALAVSVAFRVGPDDVRPFSLMAGVAAARVIDGTLLKWPNDVLLGEDKVGGILVERSEDTVVTGLGVNLWWPEPSDGAGAVYESDPGEEAHAEMGALWAAEFLGMVDRPGWPSGEYRNRCATLGMEIRWEPNGRGVAVGITGEGALIVERGGVTEIITSGAIRHVRPAT